MSRPVSNPHPSAPMQGAINTAYLAAKVRLFRLGGP
jgi:hypothetical protein